MSEIDRLINYFTDLKTCESIDLSQLESQIFDTCAKNFLSGSQITIVKTGIQNQHQCMMERGQNGSTVQYCSFDLAFKNIIDFLNEKPRKRWVIESKRFLKEINETNQQTKSIF